MIPKFGYNLGIVILLTDVHLPNREYEYVHRKTIRAFFECYGKHTLSIPKYLQLDGMYLMHTPVIVRGDSVSIAHRRLLFQSDCVYRRVQLEV